MRLPELAPLASPEPPSGLPGILQWTRGASGYLKRLTDRLNETVRALHQVADGHGHLRGSVTLTAGATTTAVTATGLPAAGIVLLTAGPGTWTSTALRVSAVAKDTFTITHSNEAATDRVVFYQAGVPG